MLSDTLSRADRGHAHGVDLEATFDFLNTADTDNGFPVDKLASLEDALAWFVDRGVIHREGADRDQTRVATQPASAARDLDRIHAVRDALRMIRDIFRIHANARRGLYEAR